MQLVPARTYDALVSVLVTSRAIQIVDPQDKLDKSAHAEAQNSSAKDGRGELQPVSGPRADTVEPEVRKHKVAGRLWARLCSARRRGVGCLSSSWSSPWGGCPQSVCGVVTQPIVLSVALGSCQAVVLLCQKVRVLYRSHPSSLG